MILVDIITSAIAVFELSISKVFNDGEIDEWEFAMLQTLHLEALNGLASVNCKMQAETRTQLQKSLLEVINDVKRTVKGTSPCAVSHVTTSSRMDKLSSICYQLSPHTYGMAIKPSRSCESSVRRSQRS